MNRKKMMRVRQKQARNIIIVEAMRLTGWSRERVIESLGELEAVGLVKFPSNGGFMIKENAEVI
ncbi:hypothetical protein [Streptococcus sp. zg-JUN1979]|uniref:hypothetical protein n=1 Tax=Streptococcus sp. zg-JUN1979 TaxID=3391450 RepID=UPI0039A605E8